MVMTHLRHIALAAISLIIGASNAHAVSHPSGELQCGTSIYGAWVTTKGDSVINIHDCDKSGICGEIVKFTNGAKYSELTPETAIPLSDKSGPRILSEFRAKSKNKYKGRIFNPRNGKSYKSIIKVSEMGDLKVKGCLGPVCETKIWMRPEICNF